MASTKSVQHMAIDQYGRTEHNLGAHPRQELLRRMGASKASRMFIDTDNGSKHVGWVIRGYWWTVYQVTPMRKAA